MAALAKDPAQRWQSAEDFAGRARGGARADRGRAQRRAGHGGVRADPDAGGRRDRGHAGCGRHRPGARAGDRTARGARARAGPGSRSGSSRSRWSAPCSTWSSAARSPPEKKEVPRVTGKQLVEARALMERAGFEVQTERVRSSQPFDQVVDQDPNPGEEAEEGSTVTLEVSDGPGNVLVPPVANLRQGQAIKELEDAGLKVTVDSELVGQGEEGLRHPDRAAGGQGGHEGHARAAARELRPRAGGRAGRDRALARVRGGAPARRGVRRRPWPSRSPTSRRAT